MTRSEADSDGSHEDGLAEGRACLRSLSDVRTKCIMFRELREGDRSMQKLIVLYSFNGLLPNKTHTHTQRCKSRRKKVTKIGQPKDKSCMESLTSN